MDPPARVTHPRIAIGREEGRAVEIDDVAQLAKDERRRHRLAGAVDSLPDAVLGDVDIARNYEQLAPLDEYLENYAPAVTAFFDSRDDYPASLIAPDGKIQSAQSKKSPCFDFKRLDHILQFAQRRAIFAARFFPGLLLPESYPVPKRR